MDSLHLNVSVRALKAKLRTGGKTLEEIKARYDGPEPSKEEIQTYKKALDTVNELEVIVILSSFTNNYSLAIWDEKDDEKIRDFIYLIEQDPYFGSYIDEREEFLLDWESGDYSPSGSISFVQEDVEILEEIKKDGPDI